MKFLLSCATHKLGVQNGCHRLRASHLILIKARSMGKRDPAIDWFGVDFAEPPIEADGLSMRLRKTICGFLVALAVALLPLANSATACTQIPQDASAIGTPADSIVSAANDEPTAQIDDCCLTHETQGDPCSSAACCTVHCAVAALLVSVDHVNRQDAQQAVPPVRDQVFLSAIDLPPFRPPRA